jgi:hypothetical protein
MVEPCEVGVIGINRADLSGLGGRVLRRYAQDLTQYPARNELSGQNRSRHVNRRAPCDE